MTEPSDGIGEAIGGAARVGIQAGALGVEEWARARRERAEREAAQAVAEARTAGRRADALEAADVAVSEALTPRDGLAQIRADEAVRGERMNGDPATLQMPAVRDPADARTEVIPAVSEDRAWLSREQHSARAELVKTYGEQWHTRDDLPDTIRGVTFENEAWNEHQVPVRRIREWHEQYGQTFTEQAGERDKALMEGREPPPIVTDVEWEKRKDRVDLAANAGLLRDPEHASRRAELPSIDQLIPRDPVAQAARLQARVADKAAAQAVALAGAQQARPAAQVPVTEAGKSAAPVARRPRVKDPERQAHRTR